MQRLLASDGWKQTGYDKWAPEEQGGGGWMHASGNCDITRAELILRQFGFYAYQRNPDIRCFTPKEDEMPPGQEVFLDERFNWG